VADPAATERALAGRAANLDAKRERLIDLAADGVLGKADLAARLAGVKAEREGTERELARVRGAAERVREMEQQKRLLVEVFGTGLKLGLTWMPPPLRREIYEAIGLRVTVSADGAMRAEARVDGAALRYSREVERYARALVDADRRIKEAGDTDGADGLERVERELARVGRELSSPTGTDTGHGGCGGRRGQPVAGARRGAAPVLRGRGAGLG
jgi:hypothetical protein